MNIAMKNAARGIAAEIKADILDAQRRRGRVWAMVKLDHPDAGLTLATPEARIEEVAAEAAKARVWAMVAELRRQAAHAARLRGWRDLRWASWGRRRGMQSPPQGHAWQTAPPLSPAATEPTMARIEREARGALLASLSRWATTAAVRLENGPCCSVRVDRIESYDSYSKAWHRRNGPAVTHRTVLSIGGVPLARLWHGARIGIADNLLTVAYSPRTHQATWIRRTRDGSLVENGYMVKAPDGRWIHGPTLEAVQATLKRRMAKPKAGKRKPLRATFRMARSLGLCAEGIDAWLEEHGKDRSWRPTREELLALDGNNVLVARVAEELR